MKKLTTLAASLVGLLVLAGTASAFISYPNASCPDSVTIHQIWAGGACQPTGGNGAVGDTVHGVTGIITAFDVRPSTFSFYMQNNATVREQIGMYVYTGSRNYNSAPYGWAPGDSVSVYLGGVENYNYSKEIVGPNNITNTNIIVGRRGTTTVMAPQVLNTTQLNWNVANTASDKWLCTLVRIDGPLYVRRSSGNNVYLVDPTHASDTLQVFGAKFITAGTVIGSSTPNGTLINFVQGIYENGGGTFSYQLMVRDANDVAVATPPNVSDAYPIDDTHVRVLFDKALDTPTATDVSNYTLGSFGSVDAAVMDGAFNVILAINNGLNHGDYETVTVNGVKNTLDPQDIMTTPQTRTFINGVLTVAEVSAPNPDSLLATPCFDRSRFAGPGGQISLGLVGPRLSMTGVSTGILNNTYYMEDQSPAATGNHGGITLFGAGTPLVVGHKYLVAGNVEEYFGETEFANPVYLVDRGAVPMPLPWSFAIPITVTSLKDTCNAPGPNGEFFESMLVMLKDVKRVIRYDYATKPINGFHVVGSYPLYADTVFVLNYGSALGTPDSNNVNYPSEGAYIDIVGEVHYDPSRGFNVCPRSAADILPYFCFWSWPNCTDVPPSPTSAALTLQFLGRNVGSSAHLGYTLPVAGNVNLSVYDVAGRVIRCLDKGYKAAGVFSATWNGRDESGHAVGSGVFFYRLTAGGQVVATRGIFIRS
jgi:hypothetical protein